MNPQHVHTSSLGLDKKVANNTDQKRKLPLLWQGHPAQNSEVRDESPLLKSTKDIGEGALFAEAGLHDPARVHSNIPGGAKHCKFFFKGAASLSLILILIVVTGTV